MNNFFKITLASILGVIVGSIILTLLSLGIFSMIISATQNDEVKIKENTILLLDFKAPIVDRAANNPFEGFDFMSMKPNTQQGLNDILDNLQKAKKDDNIDGVYMQLSGITAGMATIEEIRDALIDFKESGKFIIAYADYYTQTSYYLASVADEIYMNPLGELNLIGFRAEIMFFTNALDKMGIEPQIIRHGKFKSAVEPFLLTEMSESNRLQTKTYVGSMWNHLLKGIGEQRGIEVTKLQEMTDALTIRNAKAAVDNNLVDDLKYKDEIIDLLKEKTNCEEKKDLRAIKLAKYTKVPEKRETKGLVKEKIAVVYALGTIDMGEGSATAIGSENISKALREVRRDSTVKAIVLRVNSPGGSALASDIILREVKLAAQTKPLIVSMGDVAASGGYYIACAADAIVASPNTITGSIGVFGMLFNMQELLNEKIGIMTDGVSTGNYADIGSVTRPLTQDERAIIQEGIEEIYTVFIGHVAEGRDMNTEDVDNIGQGRVWSGVNAKEIGLIDEFGGLTKAIAMAKDKAGLENYRVVDYPKQKTPFEQLTEDLMGNARITWLKSQLNENYTYWEQLQEISKMRGVQARMPYVPKIN